MSDLIETLANYQYIEHYYGKYLDHLTREKHPLFLLIKNNGSYLKEFNQILQKLDNIVNLTHLVKKSKNPADFWSIVFEMEVSADLTGKVESLSFIISKDPSPDIKIRKSNFEITIEVKRVTDKFEVEIRKYLTKPPLVLEMDDISTVNNAIKKSINKEQYCHNSAHLFVFDARGTMSEDEFDDLLCQQDGKPFFFTNSQGSTGIGYQTHDGLFYEKDENMQFPYAMIAGVVAYFDSQTSVNYDTKRTVVKGPRKIYFENPNALRKIPKQIIEEIGFQLFTPSNKR